MSSNENYPGQEINSRFVYTPAPEESVHRQTGLFYGIPLLKQVLDAVGVALVGLNGKLQIVVHNRGFLELVGGASGDVVGMRIGQALGCIHQVDGFKGCGTSEFCPKCGALQSMFASLNGMKDVRECQITRNSGGTVQSLDLQVTSTPIRIEEEEFTLFSIVDISHEKRRRALEKIFFHDILNTADQIRRFSRMITEGGDTPDGRRGLEILDALAGQLVAEIRGQRDLLSAEANELSVNPAPLDSLRLLQEIRRQFLNPAVTQEYRIEIAAEAEPVAFISDPALINRVITNMVRNALEASNPRDTVTLSCCRSGGEMVEFRVHNPMFIPRDVQLQIFQRSFSTKGRNRGLGTYSMRLLSERYLKGRVTFSTSPEEGTIFVARYPLNLLKANGYVEAP